MRSFAILATIFAATVGTASGKNTVLLVHIQHVCNAKGLSPIPGPNTLSQVKLISIAMPGLYLSASCCRVELLFVQCIA